MRRGEGKRQDTMRRAIAQSVYQRFRATLRGAVSSVTVLVNRWTDTEITRFAGNES